jgi:hypothetical protein
LDVKPYKRSVWRDLDRKNTQYVPRCSKCGGFKEDLKEHWFFTGIYCVLCIRYTLYDDTYVPYYGEEK